MCEPDSHSCGDGLTPTSLTFECAKEQFVKLLESVSQKDVPSFLQWVTDSFDTSPEENNKKSKALKAANRKVNEIVEHLKLRVPQSAVMVTEKVLWPKNGHDSDCTEVNTVHVDNFLFDEDDVDRLVEEGKLTRNYCGECGSKDTKPLNFISHSLSVKQIEFMFTHLVPLAKQKKTVVDIGSRLGGVLYGASLYGGKESQLIGIELNQEMVDLQNDVIKQFGLQNIEVVCADIRSQQEILQTADVIVMNNVFNFFLSEAEQISCWEFLHKTLKKGCVIIHNPDIPSVVAHLTLSFKVEDWLQEKKTTQTILGFCSVQDEIVYEDCCQLHMYRVI